MFQDWRDIDGAIGTVPDLIAAQMLKEFLNERIRPNQVAIVDQIQYRRLVSIHRAQCPAFLGDLF